MATEKYTDAHPSWSNRDSWTAQQAAWLFFDWEPRAEELAPERVRDIIYRITEQLWHPRREDGRIPRYTRTELRPLAVQLGLRPRFLWPEESVEKPIHRTERDTFLLYLAALAAVLEVDISHPDAAGKELSDAMAAKGYSVGPSTTEKRLKELLERISHLRDRKP